MDEMIEWYRQLNKNVKGAIKFVGFALIVGAIVWLVNAFLWAPMLVNGDSMKPTLSDDDIIIIDKLAYKTDEPERYDIVVFKYKYDYSQLYIKRIIGMPGETLYIKDNEIFILNEETGKFEELKEYYGVYEGEAEYPDCDEVTLGEDEYFVLGDNRNDSEDSRSTGVGVVPKKLLIGKAAFRLLPFEGIGSLEYQ